MMEVVEGESAMEDLRQGDANEHSGAIDEDVQDLEANFMTSIKIFEYALTTIIYDIDDVLSSDPLEIEDEAQDVFKEDESIAEAVDQSGIGSCPQEVQNSQGLEKDLEEADEYQFGTKLDPQEIIDEIVVYGSFHAIFHRLTQMQS